MKFSRSILLALIISLVVHGLLAVGLIVYLEYAPAPDAVATLDLTSVELSFAEKVEETAAPVLLAQPSKPKADEKPLETKKGPSKLIPRSSSFVPASQAAPRQARIDAPPSPKKAIRPDYPKGARQRGEQGEVVLEIRVDDEGAVSEAKVVVSSGFAELDEAAVRAAETAKFRPAKSGNKSVVSTVRLKLDFKLR